MAWFQKLTGFRETSYEHARQNLFMQGSHLVSRVNNQSYDIGEFKFSSLAKIRQLAAAQPGAHDGTFTTIVGNVAVLHTKPEYDGALFQVASQFNALEMTSPSITPEAGVGIYEHDRTQGPACAISAGAATIFRNYFVFGTEGQTRDHQLDGLADLGAELVRNGVAKSVSELWDMRNGYALAKRRGLGLIRDYIATLTVDEYDALVSKLAFAMHFDAQVTTAAGTTNRVSQIFCSALPVAYTNIPAGEWGPFAQLVLDGVYEATLLVGRLNMLRGRSNLVMLTRVGGGVFGNRDAWIDQAIKRALRVVDTTGLDIRMVKYG